MLNSVVTGASKRCFQDLSVDNNENANRTRQKTGHLSSVSELPVAIKVNVLSYLTKQNRLLTDNMRQPGRINVALTFIGKNNIADARVAFSLHKASYFNDSTVSIEEKLSLIENNEELEINRKGALHSSVQDIRLTVHSLRQAGISFSPQEIDSALNDADIGVVGAVIENSEIPLSSDQVRHVWDRDEAYLKAMIVKVRRDDIQISDEEANKYSLAEATLPIENEIMARRGGIQEMEELRQNPNAPQVKAAYIDETHPYFIMIAQHANRVQKPLTPGQIARFDSIERETRREIAATGGIDWNQLFFSQLQDDISIPTRI